MKKYYIEINEQQPLELIEKRLQEMGYESDEKWNASRTNMNNDCVLANENGEYRIYFHEGNFLGHEVLTLRPNLSQALAELEKSLNELKTAFEEVRQAIRNEPT